MNTQQTSPIGAVATAAIRSRWMDAVLRRRSADILAKTGLVGHLPESGVLLDLGAGLGHLAEAVRNSGTARCCVALDPVWSPAPPLAARLRRGGPGWVKAVHGDGAALPFATGSFDGAWCAFVLHHLPPAMQAAVLAEVFRVLRPGGVFALIEDTPAGPATLAADRRLNREDDAAPHHYRRPDEWRDLLHAAGFEPGEETPFTAVFPRATLRRVQHRMFVCRAAPIPSRLRADAPPSPPPC